MTAMEFFGIRVGGVLYPDKMGVGFRTDAFAHLETGEHLQSVGV